MGGFLIRRAGAALVVLVIASMLVFLGVRAIPGDPAIALGAENRDPVLLAQIRHKYLLDRPLPVQYAHWGWRAGEMLGLGGRVRERQVDDRESRRCASSRRATRSPATSSPPDSPRRA